MQKLHLSTTNPHKVEKLTQLFSRYFPEIVVADRSITIDENGSTFRENAEIKALAASKHHHGYAAATDGGVLIPALGNKWNSLLTKRFIGRDDATDFDRMDALLDLMKDKTGDERAIIWNEAIALAKDGTVIFSCQVEGDRGMLQTSYNKSQYQKGIWQCTLTCYPQFQNKNFFELNEEERQYGEMSWRRLGEAIDDFMKG